VEPLRIADFMDLQYQAAESLTEMSKMVNDLMNDKMIADIRDSVSNFKAMNLAGVPCLLMDAESNQDWGPIGRVYSLREAEIEEVYYLFMDTIFHNFKNLL
jgi:hypothetical protein